MRCMCTFPSQVVMSEGRGWSESLPHQTVASGVSGAPRGLAHMSGSPFSKRALVRRVPWRSRLGNAVTPKLPGHLYVARVLCSS
jgi:hypothetical protein